MPETTCAHCKFFMPYRTPGGIKKEQGACMVRGNWEDQTEADNTCEKFTPHTKEETHG